MIMVESCQTSDYLSTEYIVVSDGGYLVNMKPLWLAEIIETTPF